jgi:hypothetical protein
MTLQMDDRLTDEARLSPEWVARRGKPRSGRASAAFDKAFGLLFVVGLGLAGFGIVAGLIYAAVVWSLLAVIPLGLYLTAWLLTIRN